MANSGLDSIVENGNGSGNTTGSIITSKQEQKNNDRAWFDNDNYEYELDSRFVGLVQKFKQN